MEEKEIKSSSEIIRSINKIYSHFKIPPWLQMHMLRVSSVANLICDNLDGQPVNTNDAVAATMLHDLGNIIKIDLKTSSAIMGVEAVRLSYWETVKAETIAKYGNNEHIATVAMAKEIGATPRVIYLIESIGVSKIKEVEAGGDLERKICSYADLRVGPFGVLSLEGRFADFLERYKIRHTTLSQEQFENAFSIALQMEKEIISSTSLTAEQINDKSIAPYIRKYAKTPNQQE
ncbi:MAG: hypothetical protein QXS81_04170 [Candidatus Micrarchaeaceae archaeon]